MKENSIKRIKAVDFFCSAGGVSCWLKQAGIKVLEGIDIDPACRITHEKNINAYTQIIANQYFSYAMLVGITLPSLKN